MICGTGLGTAIAANRYQGIHCTPCHDVTTARMARAHNDANILNLGGRVIGTFQAEEIIKAFASTDFIGDRYQLRKDMIDKMGCCS
jgi:ribose 5-phosphate isomerase B